MAIEKLGRRGVLLVLSSPSGAGKTTLSRRLLSSETGLSMSVSVTTRPPRPGEREGVDYHFVTKRAFSDAVAQGNFLEYAEVFGNFYGTLKAPVCEALERGEDMLFDIDWQGTQQLFKAMPDDIVRIFILPPTAHALRDRLINRAQDCEETVRRRMDGAAEEIRHWSEYEYVLINDDLDRCDEALRAILTAERLRRWRQVGLPAFVRDLLQAL